MSWMHECQWICHGEMVKPRFKDQIRKGFGLEHIYIYTVYIYIYSICNPINWRLCNSGRPSNFGECRKKNTFDKYWLPWLLLWWTDGHIHRSNRIGCPRTNFKKNGGAGKFEGEHDLHPEKVLLPFCCYLFGDSYMSDYHSADIPNLCWWKNTHTSIDWCPILDNGYPLVN